ncbi:MAG: DNA polymerase III subunit delta [Bacteroidaceae bacterium]|nr:DNA polymerase III subunit delta [Bacteroidaceae bacterium]
MEQTTGWRFADVVGHEEQKARIRQLVDGAHMPHALMLHGSSGVGKLALALATARYMLCRSPHDGEPCGECEGCRMSSAWSHPDLHFSFPIFKQKSSENPVSDDYLKEWRQQLNDSVYFDQSDWLRRLGGENQQLQFYVGEAESLQRKLALKSSQGGNRVVVMWLPEKMGDAMANKLLKLIEEPPSRTYFLLVSERPDDVLGTIQSRTQMMRVNRIDETLLAQALQTLHAVPAELAQATAHMTEGSYTRALHQLTAGNDRSEAFELFMQLMRLAYVRNIKSLREWSDTVTAMGRERQKHLLEHFQLFVRENFIYNFQQHATLNYQSPEEAQFSQRFARFIHERNVIPMTSTLADCQRDIESNVSARMVFFDLAIRMIYLLKS